MNTKL
jgi:hypothetical protein